MTAMKKLSYCGYVALLGLSSSLAQAIPHAQELTDENLWAGVVNRDYPQSTNSIEIDYSYLFFKPRYLGLTYRVNGLCSYSFYLGVAQQGVGVFKKPLEPCNLYNVTSGYYTTDVTFCAYDNQLKSICSRTTGEIFVH
jgi:hypothetical protein